MIHSSLFVSGIHIIFWQPFLVVLLRHIFIVVCRRDSSVDFTRLQYITILEAGRWPICFQVMFNIVSDEVWGNFVCRHVEQIRTAARDGDRAVGVNRTVAVEPRPSPSNPISQYQNVLLERNNSNTNIDCSNKFDKHDSLYTNLNWVLFYKRQINKC